MLENEIVLRLIQDAPNQSIPEQLEENKLLHHCTAIFDREDYCILFTLFMLILIISPAQGNLLTVAL